MAKTKLNFDVEIPEGFVFDGYRTLKAGDWFLDEYGRAVMTEGKWSNKRICLRQTANEMPIEMVRRLYGVIPAGYWIAWNEDGEPRWYENRLKRVDGKWWQVVGWEGSLPPSIEKSDGIPWNESAMQMPEGEPKNGRSIWITKDCVDNQSGYYFDCDNTKEQRTEFVEVTP